MSHIFQVDDSHYEAIARAAAHQHKSPEQLFAEWVEEMRIQRLADRVFSDEDSFMREALGMSDNEITQAEQLRQQQFGEDDANL